MSRQTMLAVLTWFATLALLLPAGCLRPKSNHIETCQAGGMLYVAGKPAAGARVQLNPVEDARLAGLYPHAVVERDGSFQLTTYKTHDGAPPGKYTLTVTWPLPPRPNREIGPDRLAGRYSDRRKPAAQVQINAGVNDLGTIRLK